LGLEKEKKRKEKEIESGKIVGKKAR